MSDSIRQLHLLGATGTARTEMDGGKEYLVVPVVALMEGVIHAVNAHTPEFVPCATLERAAETWNGKPVTLGHPAKNGKQCSANDAAIVASHGIGVIRNSRYDATAKKLLQEAWIEKTKAKQLHPTMFARLEADGHEEVSVGAFVHTDDTPGTHNDRRFMASWVHADGDHLAFLPGGRGACSGAMGCGANRAAMHFVTAEGIVVEDDQMPNVAAFFRSLMPRGWGDDEVKEELRNALLMVEPALRNGEILRITNNTIVYCIYPPPAQPYDMTYPKMTYWQRPYTFETLTRAFSLGERAQVEPTTVYETLKGLKGKPAYKDCPACDGTGSKDGNPCEACDGNGELKVAAASTHVTVDLYVDGKKVAETAKKILKTPAKVIQPKPTMKAASCGCGNTTHAADCGCKHKGDTPMAEKATRAEMIAALTTDTFSGFNDQDTALLETASEARLEEFRAAADERKTQKASFVRLENEHRNVQARLKVNEERLRAAEQGPTDDEWLAKAPAPIKALLDAHKAEEDIYRTSIIVQLKDLGANTEDELKAMKTPELETLAKYAHVTVPDFSGRGLPVERHASATNDDYAPPDPYATGLKAMGGSKAVN